MASLSKVIVQTAKQFSLLESSLHQVNLEVGDYSITSYMNSGALLELGQAGVQVVFRNRMSYEVFLRGLPPEGQEMVVHLKHVFVVA